MFSKKQSISIDSDQYIQHSTVQSRNSVKLFMQKLRKTDTSAVPRTHALACVFSSVRELVHRKIFSQYDILHDIYRPPEWHVQIRVITGRLLFDEQHVFREQPDRPLLHAFFARKVTRLAAIFPSAGKKYPPKSVGEFPSAPPPPPFFASCGAFRVAKTHVARDANPAS